MEIKTKIKQWDSLSRSYIITYYEIENKNGVYFNGDVVEVINSEGCPHLVGQKFKIQTTYLNTERHEIFWNYEIAVAKHYFGFNLDPSFKSKNIILYKRPIKNWFKYIKMLITRVYVP